MCISLWLKCNRQFRIPLWRLLQSIKSFVRRQALPEKLPSNPKGIFMYTSVSTSRFKKALCTSNWNKSLPFLTIKETKQRIVVILTTWEIISVKSVHAFWVQPLITKRALCLFKEPSALNFNRNQTMNSSHLNHRGKRLSEVNTCLLSATLYHQTRLVSL